MSLYDMMFRGGFLMWPIFLCSLLATYVVIERYLVLRRARLDAGQFLLKLKSIYRHGDVNAVLTYCSQKDAPIANIVRRGVLKHGQGDVKVREAVENAGREEVFHLEKRLAILASISGVAPMLGFLGTVTGMINAFRIIELQSGIVGPSALAGGIWEALLTTAFGLIIGIPALLFYNYFVTRVLQLVHEMEVTTNEFLDMVEEGPGAPAAGVSGVSGVARVAGGDGEPARSTTRPVLPDEEYFRRKE